MSAHVVIARWTAREGEEEAVAAVLRELAEESRREPGCIDYRVTRSLDDPRTFLLYEEYVDADAFQAHRESEHFERLARGRAIPLLETRHVEQYERIV